MTNQITGQETDSVISEESVDDLCSSICFFLSLSRLPPWRTLFPYTTLFRSLVGADPKPLRELASRGAVGVKAPRDARSEEHTSELQSRRDLVCRLLLEKKK